VSFSGRDRVDVKRRALDYWYQNRERLGLSLCRFLLQCKMSGDGRTIVFEDARPPEVWAS
jgi:hypothetical protein